MVDKEVITLQVAMKEMLVIEEEQNKRILKLSELSKGQLGLISALSTTINLIAEKVDILTEILKREKENDKGF